MAEVALVYKRIYVAVPVLGEVHIIVSMVKAHITGNNVPETTIAVAVADTEAIQVVFERRHVLFFIELGQREVFTHRVSARRPAEADFTPLDLVERTGNHVFLAEGIRQVQNPEGRREFETVRLRNRPEVFLDAGLVIEAEVIRNRLLLRKVRGERRGERQERNQARVKANLELLATGTFVTQNTVSTAEFTGTDAVHLVERRRR